MAAGGVRGGMTRMTAPPWPPRDEFSAGFGGTPIWLQRGGTDTEYLKQASVILKSEQTSNKYFCYTSNVCCMESCITPAGCAIWSFLIHFVVVTTTVLHWFSRVWKSLQILIASTTVKWSRKGTKQRQKDHKRNEGFVVVWKAVSKHKCGRKWHL